jgi:hypothetical protein
VITATALPSDILHDSRKFVRKLTGQRFTETFGDAAVIPKSSFLGLAEAGPDFLPIIWRPQITMY